MNTYKINLGGVEGILPAPDVKVDALRSSETAPGVPEFAPLAEQSTDSFPTLSVVIPCRNEEKHLSRCLDSLIQNDYPRERLEILIVDGQSEDKTREIIASYMKRYSHIRLVDNPRRAIPIAMNLGIKAATGDIIVKIDAHSWYQPNHIRDCVKYQIAYKAENVGGVWNMHPGASTHVARAIVIGMASRFGSGNALVKMRVDKPTWSDSVAFGCYRKRLLEKLGGFNEQLRGSSDMDLNYRIRAAGGRILLIPQVVVHYVADANLKALWQHNIADGVWATYVLKFKSKAWSWRHWVPLSLVLSLIATLGLAARWPVFAYLFLFILGSYFAGNVGTSLYLALHKQDWKMIYLLPAVFVTRHLAHGLGALYGLILLPLPGVRWKGRRHAQG